MIHHDRKYNGCKIDIKYLIYENFIKYIANSEKKKSNNISSKHPKFENYIRNF